MNMFLPFWGNTSQPNALHFFNTIKGKGRGRLGLMKIGSRCWRRRMGKVVYSKGERIAQSEQAQLERATGPQLFCSNLQPHQLMCGGGQVTSTTRRKWKIISKQQGCKRSIINSSPLRYLQHLHLYISIPGAPRRSSSAIIVFCITLRVVVLPLLGAEPAHRNPNWWCTVMSLSAGHKSHDCIEGKDVYIIMAAAGFSSNLGNLKCLFHKNLPGCSASPHE